MNISIVKKAPSVVKYKNLKKGDVFTFCDMLSQNNKYYLKTGSGFIFLNNPISEHIPNSSELSNDDREVIIFEAELIIKSEL